MRNLFEPAAVQEIRDRLGRLRPDSKPQWGKMNVAQAMAHVANALENATGDATPPRMFVGRIFGRLVKKLAIGNESPLKRNTPTAPGLLIVDERDFARERERVSGLVDRFAGKTVTSHPHPFFGRMTAEEWGVLMYKHLDHHLRQFGA
jgi:hypothetical protein